MPSSASGILTIPEIAKYLKVTEKTIYKLAGARKIPAFKVGGSWRFSKADIDHWITQQSATTGQMVAKVKATRSAAST